MNNNNKMRPCNKNQFQSIRKQKQNATTTQKYKKMKKIKKPKTQIETFFHYFSTEGTVELDDFGDLSRFRRCDGAGAKALN